MPRAKKVVAESQADGSPILADLVTLRYSPEDMEKLDQFAIGLLRDGTAGINPQDQYALQCRVRDAYLRAEVMLTIRKEIAALEA